MTRPARLVLLGHPVAHSLSPRLQGAALRSAGIDIRYEAIDVAPTELARELDKLLREGAAGNVTIPHKEQVAGNCASLTPIAQITGAVNAFRSTPDGREGHNTDVGGFDEAARALLGGAVQGRTVALIGAGGSAAAVLAAIAQWPGARVLIYNRSSERATALARRFPDTATVAGSIAEATADASLIVNATPVGLATDGFPIPSESIPPGADIFDLVYRRGETAWVRAARARGHQACDGLAMLIAQGALAFEWWLGEAADREAMLRAAHEPA